MATRPPCASGTAIRCATEILSALARQAYRRPVTDQDVQVLMGFFESGRAQSFDAGIQKALERLLVAPEFLYRVERDPAAVSFLRRQGYSPGTFQTGETVIVTGHPATAQGARGIDVWGRGSRVTRTDGTPLP